MDIRIKLINPNIITKKVIIGPKKNITRKIIVPWQGSFSNIGLEKNLITTSPDIRKHIKNKKM